MYIYILMIIPIIILIVLYIIGCIILIKQRVNTNCICNYLIVGLILYIILINNYTNQENLTTKKNRNTTKNAITLMEVATKLLKNGQLTNGKHKTAQDPDTADTDKCYTQIKIQNKTNSDIRYFLTANLSNPGNPDNAGSLWENSMSAGNMIVNDNKIKKSEYACIDCANNLKCKAGLSKQVDPKTGKLSQTNTVISFIVPVNGEKVFYTDYLESGIIWGAPASNKFISDISQGRGTGMSSVELTISNVGLNCDSSAVDGINYGIQTAYYPNGKEDPKNAGFNNSCMPLLTKDIITNYGYNIDGYNCIVSDKWLPHDRQKKLFGSIFPGLKYQNKSVDELLKCGATLSNKYCGQKTCRQFYNKLNKEAPFTYCNWLHKSACMGYCWAMDEAVCNDVSDKNDDRQCGWYKCDADGEYSCFKDKKTTCEDVWPDYPITDKGGLQASWLSCGCTEQAATVQPTPEGWNYCKTNEEEWIHNDPGCKDHKIKGGEVDPQSRPFNPAITTWDKSKDTVKGFPMINKGLLVITWNDLKGEIGTKWPPADDLPLIPLPCPGVTPIGCDPSTGGLCPGGVKCPSTKLCPLPSNPTCPDGSPCNPMCPGKSTPTSSCAPKGPIKCVMATQEQCQTKLCSPKGGPWYACVKKDKSISGCSTTKSDWDKCFSCVDYSSCSGA